MSNLRKIIEGIDKTLEGAEKDFITVDDGCITLEWRCVEPEKLQKAKEQFSDKGLVVGSTAAWLDLIAKGCAYGSAVLDTSKGVY
jgi:hypothetical protein